MWRHRDAGSELVGGRLSLCAADDGGRPGLLEQLLREAAQVRQPQRHQLGAREPALELAAVLVVVLLSRLQLPREERLHLLLVSAGRTARPLVRAAGLPPTDMSSLRSEQRVYSLQTLRSSNSGQAVFYM